MSGATSWASVHTRWRERFYMESEALSSKNWMAGLSDRTPFYDILLPGSHDAGTFAFFGNAANLPFVPFVRTQNHSFDEQLNNGIRFLDLRVRKISENPGDNLALFHGDGTILGASKSFYLNKNLDDALGSAKQFLEKNPSESIVISIKREDGPTEGARTDITAQDIQEYISKYQFNSSLAQDSNHLWVAGHIDFERIEQARKKNGLNDLNTRMPLSTVNPRVSTNAKLNYQNLALGDVRGRIILYLRDMPNYSEKDNEGSGWKTSNIAALDSGTFSYGVAKQDNYDGPEYRKKKNDIIEFAKKISDDQYRINFTSAASSGINVASSPAAFALTVNAGLEKNGYETDDSTSKTSRSPSLKTLLSAGGDLYTWNIEQRKDGKSGLNGAMVGDFLTNPQESYDRFWDSIWTSRRYLDDMLEFGMTGNASDHLTKLIWRQNTTYAPILKGFVDDPVTGIPTIAKEYKFQILLKRYLPDSIESEAGFILSEITPLEAGLSDENALITRETSSIYNPALLKLRVGKSGGKVEKHSTVRDEKFEYQGLNSKMERLTIRLKEGADDPIGRRYFSFVNTIDGKEIGSPYVFAVSDSSLLFG